MNFSWTLFCSFSRQLKDCLQVDLYFESRKDIVLNWVRFYQIFKKVTWMEFGHVCTWLVELTRALENLLFDSFWEIPFQKIDNHKYGNWQVLLKWTGKEGCEILRSHWGAWLNNNLSWLLGWSSLGLFLSLHASLVGHLLDKGKAH